MKNILVPTDLTNCTLNTIKHALSLCSKTNTKLFFYHSSMFKFTKSDAQNIILNAFKELNFFYDESMFDILIEENDFSNINIKNVIDKNNIDLVIMGTSPKGPGLTFFESRVTELINEISCPLLSVPHDFLDLQIDRIGYATELYDLSERIKEIIPFARLLDASIEAFHVYPVFPQEVNIEEFNVKQVLSRISDVNQYSKINLHFVKTSHENELAHGIREFLKIYKPDLLVMCHKPRGLFDKIVLDSGVTNAIVKTSPIPILALNRKTACKIM
jgi:nucleotide-binding universal stress UspA family protein